MSVNKNALGVYKRNDDRWFYKGIINYKTWAFCRNDRDSKQKELLALIKQENDPKDAFQKYGADIGKMLGFEIAVSRYV